VTANAPAHGRARRALAATAAVLGVLAAVVGSPSAPEGGRSALDVGGLARAVVREEDHVTALELAQWIRERRPGLRVIDVRTPAEFDEFHVPTAERVALDTLVATPFGRDETVVLYSEGGAHAAQGWVLLRALGHERVYFLRGGLYEWLEQVMNPHVPSTTPQAQRDSIRALTLWFGGKMTVVDSASTVPSAPDRELSAPHKSDARESIRKIRRRAC